MAPRRQKGKGKPVRLPKTKIEKGKHELDPELERLLDQAMIDHIEEPMRQPPLTYVEVSELKHVLSNALNEKSPSVTKWKSRAAEVFLRLGDRIISEIQEGQIERHSRALLLVALNRLIGAVQQGDANTIEVALSGAEQARAIAESVSNSTGDPRED